MMEITTTRLFIRRFVKEDIPLLMMYRNDLIWMKYQGFKGLSQFEYEKELLYEYPLEEGIQLAIIHKQSHQLIGDLYLKKEGDVFWIGYTISPVYARQGYAYEATRALLDHLKKLGAKWIKADVDKNNVASLGLLKKLQFDLEDETNDSFIYALKVS